MKQKLFISLLLLLVSTGLMAQASYIRNIPITMPYPEFYDYRYTPKQIFPCPDRGVIILGDIQVHLASGELEPYVNYDGGAIKLDASGNCEWQWWSGNILSYTEPATGIIGIDQEADGRVNFIINNYLYNYHFTNKLGWIDPQGNYSLQNITLPNCTLNAARRLPNNDIFAVGQGDAGALFLHLTAQGDTLSSNSIPPDSMSTWINPLSGWGSTAYDLEIDTDGFPVSTCTLTDRGASIVKTDWDGNVIWRRDTNNRTLLMPVPITKVPITNELLFGYQSFSNNLWNNYHVYSVSDTGIDSLFTIQLTNGECFGFYNSIIGGNGRVYLSGSYGEGGPTSIGQNVHISDYSLSGQCNWDWSWQPFPYFSEDYSPSPPTDCIVVLSDSTILHIIGYDWGNYGLTVVRLLPNGTSVEDNILPKQNVTLNAYPNPMRTSVNIEVKSVLPIKEHKPCVNIYNMKGQLIRRLSLELKSSNNLSIVWDGKDLDGFTCSSGVYIIEIKSHNSTVSKKINLIK